MIHQNNPGALYRQQINKAFINAANGLKFFFKNERNAIIQTGIAAFIMLAGMYLHLSSFEWITILLCIGAVIALEMMNTALEHLCDLIHKDFHPAIKIIKDVAAGAVLFASIISAIIGFVIFIPKILPLL